MSKVDINSIDKKVTNDVWYSESGFYVTLNLLGHNTNYQLPQKQPRLIFATSLDLNLIK